MPLSQSGTYFYTPDVRVYVYSTVLNKTINLSEDVVDFTVNRTINSTSTASLTIANAGFKYTPGAQSNHWDTATPINTMDRIVIFLKRESYVQVFSGYVTLAPVVTLLPQPVVLRAHCTLYRIQNTFWDVNHLQFQALMPGTMLTGRDQVEAFVDGGAARGILNVLDQVVGWNTNKVHIGALPDRWVKTVRSHSKEPTRDNLLLAIDAGGIIAGENLSGTTINGTGVGNYVTYSGKSPKVIQATAIPNGVYTYVTLNPQIAGIDTYVTDSIGSEMKGISFTGKEPTVEEVKRKWSKGDDPVSMEDMKKNPDWWCVVPWPYVTTTGFTQDQIKEAKDFLADDGNGGRTGRHIVLTSIANARQVIVKASIAGTTNGDIIVSPKAWKWLAGDEVATVDGGTPFKIPKWGEPDPTPIQLPFYAGTEVAVSAYWADQTTKDKKPVGKVVNNDLIKNALYQYGFKTDVTLAQSIYTSNVVVTGTKTVTKTTQTIGPSTKTPPLPPDFSYSDPKSLKWLQDHGYDANHPYIPGSTIPGKKGTKTTKKTVKTTTLKTLTTTEWAKNCLYLANFPVNDWNIQTMLVWMGLENKGDTWDLRNNPLNCAHRTIDSLDGPEGTRLGAYATLDEAAIAWAQLINPQDGSLSTFPAIQAAFSSKSRSGSSTSDRRQAIVEWANWSVANTSRFTYTMEGLRFTNVHSDPKSTSRIYCDCSAFVTYCYSWAGAPDPNNNSFNGGYTGTLQRSTTGRKILRGALKPGDIVVYGGGDGKHAVLVVDTSGQYAKNPLVAGTWGPKTIMHYRLDDCSGSQTYLTYPTAKSYMSANGPTNPFTRKPWKDNEVHQRRNILSRAITGSSWGNSNYGSDPDVIRKGVPLIQTASPNAGSRVGHYSGPRNSNGGGGNRGAGVTTLAPGSTANFNTALQSPTIDTKTYALFGKPQGFVTSQPVLSAISTMCSSSLRDFQSSPNGDFLAWFPDYFGVYDRAPVLNIYDIEIIDFQLYHDDTYLVTHVGVSGDVRNLGSSVDLYDWMMSNGVVSIQIDEVMAQLFGVTVAELNALSPDPNTSFSDSFMQRYGIRPKVQEVPIIRSHTTEFMYAWRLFAMSWAAQYSTQVQFTFMPELYPGMRIRLADHNIEVYVQSVTHQGSRTGGFTTTAQVTCPVSRDANGKVKFLHYGFPYNKATRPTSSNK